MAFDSVIPKFTKKDLQAELRNTDFSYSYPKFKPFNDSIYDCEYARLNSKKVLFVTLNINVLEIILKVNGITWNDYGLYKPFYSDLVDVTISFDNCGIGSARFDFYIENSIGVDELIEELIITCKLADEILFQYLKDDIIKNTKIHEDILEKHMVYSIISSNSPNNCTRNLCMTPKELFGISWKYPDYNYANENMVQKVIRNNIPIQEDDILTVTTQSTLMIFNDVDDYYINERILAIEMFWIQKHLLKKIDFQIGRIFDDINKDILKGDLKTAIKRIRDTKIRMQSDLDVYRNTIISVTHSFSLLFETLNNVFILDKHYNFVQEKMNSCEEIYSGLYSEEQNSLTENIQWIVIIIGSFTFILTLVVDIIYNNLSFKQSLNALTIISLISLLLIIIGRKLSAYWMKNQLKQSKLS